MALASLPEPPYVAVVFTSVRTAADPEGYARAAATMDALAAAHVDRAYGTAGSP